MNTEPWPRPKTTPKPKPAEAEPSRILPRDEAGIFTINGMSGLTLIQPDHEPGAPVPNVVALFTAIVLRCRDMDFVQEQLQWLKENPPK